MPKPKIYVHRLASWYSLYMNDDNEALLQSFAEVVSEGNREYRMNPDELIERMQGCRAILSLNGTGANEITIDALRAVGTIEVICISHTWGQFIDIAREPTIDVIEGSNANTVAVAEWTVTAALMGIRRLSMFDKKLKGGSAWAEPRRQVGLLCESVVGIVGLGRVGWYAAHYFKALGAQVIAYDQDPAKADELGVPLVSLHELLCKSDVISLHLPVTDRTRGLLGTSELGLIKDGAILLNSARAALYDEKALVAELAKHRFTAYLDVFATEPLPSDHPFRTMDNVTITPHIAGDNTAMFQRCGREAIQTLRDYFDGKGFRNLQYHYP
jgi:phosphoglycerate dehydrogenase-like enzyme